MRCAQVDRDEGAAAHQQPRPPVLGRRRCSGDSGIDSLVLDHHTSLVEGSIGAIPRRLMVAERDFGRARAAARRGRRGRPVSDTPPPSRPSPRIGCSAAGSGCASRRDGYRVAIDPVFLAAAVPAEPHQLVLDVGCGAGAAMLCLAARVPHVRVVGLEMQRDLVRLAGDNAILNAMEARVSVMIGDLLHPPPRLSPGAFDHVMANPPYHERGRATPAATPGKAAATIEGEADLAAWVRFALAMVRPKGTVTFIHRADRIDALLGEIAGRAGEVVVFPLWPGAGPAGEPHPGARPQAGRGAGAARPRAGAAPARRAADRSRRRRAARGQGARSLTVAPPGPVVAAAAAPHLRAHEHSRPISMSSGCGGAGRSSRCCASKASSCRGCGATRISLASHAAAIERAFGLRGLVAVAIVVNSPGGSPVQSALLFRRIRQLAEEKGHAGLRLCRGCGGLGRLLAGARRRRDFRRGDLAGRLDRRDQRRVRPDRG